jgi:hypothetical protein
MRPVALEYEGWIGYRAAEPIWKFWSRENFFDPARIYF